SWLERGARRRPPAWPQRTRVPPVVILFAYAELAYQVPTSTAGMIFGFGRGLGPSLASAVGVVMFLWLAAVAYRGIELHYGVTGGRTLEVFLIAGALFYLLPGLLIVAAFVAIIIAAAVLEYF